MIVLIDGDCALCVGLVEWLGQRIPDHLLSPEHIIFVPGESLWGKELLGQARITDFDSVVVLQHGQALQQSAAVLALATVLPRRWRVAAWCAGLLPRAARDALYRWVARNRINWFGRAQVCAIDSRVASVTHGPRGLLERP